MLGGLSIHVASLTARRQGNTPFKDLEAIMIRRSMFARVVLIVLCAAATAPFVAQNFLLAQNSTQFEIKATRNVMIAARDGVHLATDVYLPSRADLINGQFPTIVERTPYNKDTAAEAVVKYFVPRGYVVIY